jgi:acyl dehydratase
MMDAAPRRGLYFEEFTVGQKIATAGRTIGESDVAAFAGLSGDFNQIHTDAEFARSTPFGQRVAHGILGMAIVSGLAVQTGVMAGTVIAFREIGEWKFSRPIFLGDTIHASLEVVATKPVPRLGGGAVEIQVSVLNQKEDMVMSGRWTVLIQSRPVS